MEENPVTIQIKIKPGNPPTTADETQYTLHISKGHAQRVQWWSEDADWAVIFQDMSPFQREYFTPSHPASGGIVVDAGPTEYKYTLCANGKKSDSPIIKVDP